MLKAVTEQAAAVANELILVADEDEGPLSARKLMALVYLAHGWHLGYHHSPLLNEPIVATRYGPSIRSLEQWLRMDSKRDVRALLILRDGSSPRMANPSRMQNHLDVLWTVYGRMSANQIQRITCLDDSPWSLCWRERHENLGDELIIPDDLIYSYFSRRTNRRRGTAAANQDAFSR